MDAFSSSRAAFNLAPASNHRALSVARFSLGTLLVLASSLFGFKTPVMAQVRASATDSMPLNAPAIIAKALSMYSSITNFTTAVDIRVVNYAEMDTRPVASKESWSFSRSCPTNIFTRVRFVPIPGKEVIRSTSFSGGQLVAERIAELPTDLSLPGFELYNALLKLETSNADLSLSDSDQNVVVSGTHSNTVIRISFRPNQPLPHRCEQFENGKLKLVLTRIPGATATGILPNHDTLQLYEHGQLTTTVFRSFTKLVVRESASNPIDHEQSITSEGKR